MRFARSVAAFAGDTFPRVLQYKPRVRIVCEAARFFGVAGGTHLLANISGSRGSGRSLHGFRRNSLLSILICRVH
jgi:hypothetical protein